jgi:hypothetical protein
MPVDATPDDMIAVGLNCIGFHPDRRLGHNENTNMKHFLYAYGLSPTVCSIVFQEIQTRDIGLHQIRKPKVTYFLMALYWLKCYPIEQQNAGLFGYHEDTVRKWVWKYCVAIQALKEYKVRTL